MINYLVCELLRTKVTMAELIPEQICSPYRSKGTNVSDYCLNKRNAWRRVTIEECKVANLNNDVSFRR